MSKTGLAPLALLSTVGSTSHRIVAPLTHRSAPLAPQARSSTHLVVGVRSLPEGIAEFEQLTGIKAAVGGKHPGRGTENALVSLGEGRYLEIIAPQAGAKAGHGRRRHARARAPADHRLGGQRERRRRGYQGAARRRRRDSAAAAGLARDAVRRAARVDNLRPRRSVADAWRRSSSTGARPRSTRPPLRPADARSASSRCRTRRRTSWRPHWVRSASKGSPTRTGASRIEARLTCGDKTADTHQSPSQ